METRNLTNGTSSSTHCLLAFITGLARGTKYSWLKNLPDYAAQRIGLSPVHAQANLESAMRARRRWHTDPSVVAALVLCERFSDEELQGFLGWNPETDDVLFQVVDPSTGRWNVNTYRLGDMGVEVKG